MTRHYSNFQERLLVSVAEWTKQLPNFRGKVRGLLELYRLLGLEGRHYSVSTVLHRPVSFRVNLDLFSMHERMAFFMDGYEPGTVEFLNRLWRDGESFIDVGANIGLISIPFTLLCDRSGIALGTEISTRKRAYCIEAIESNIKALTSNIELNGLAKHIEVVGVAVGECEKDVAIQVEKNQKAGEGTGTANILAEKSDYQCERISLHVTTIDQLVANGKLPNDCGLMKIDTDGYDLFALMGAEKLIENARPVIYGEFMAHCLNWHGQTINDVQAYLHPFDYRVYVRQNGWTFAPLKNGAEFVQDALCVPVEKTDRISGCIS